MAWVATAIIAGSVISGMLGDDAASSAAGAQQRSAQMSVDEQRRQFDLTRADRLPWLTQGRAGLYKLSDLLGIDTPQGEMPTREMFTRTIPATRGTIIPLPGVTATYAGGTPARTEFDEAGYNKALAEWNAMPSGRSEEFGSLMDDFTGEDLLNEPGYQFGLNEGQRTVDQSAAARGSLFSGKTLRDLVQFGQDYGGTKYGEAFNRDAANKNRKFSMLSSLSGGGASAASDLGQAGMTSASNIAGLLTGAGNAQAAGIMGSANAWQNAIGTGINAFLTQRYIDQMKPAPTETGNAPVYTPGYGMPPWR